jgi:hypothetical protein
MGGSYSMDERDDMRRIFWLEDLKGRDYTWKTQAHIVTVS